MLFDELEVDTITHNDELYIGVSQLVKHLEGSISQFIAKSDQFHKIMPMNVPERAFIMGVIEGMSSVLVLLEQGNNEYKIGSLDTIDDLLERFKDVSS